ncbi:hypothetical protein L7F22_042244 [Adiantum nelumboides]|nr:hypothetical protein [Adiantum nelumboides]
MTLKKEDIDYSLYLVTGRELLPPGKDYYDSLEESLKDGHVTVVQLREKNVDSGDFLKIAEKSLAICDKYKVPMLINDNLSVALALPDRVDYVGVGPVYGTKSKAGIQEKDVLGPRGARQIVNALSSGDKRLPCVLIGGLNENTAGRTLFGASGNDNSPGIAVINSPAFTSTYDVRGTKDELTIKKVAELLRFHRAGDSGPPLIQTLTSHVSSTLSANIALAFSSSPIMSHQEAEADDLGRVTGAVVLNIGTIGEEARRGMRAVGSAANRGGKPVVLDPVGVGASSFAKRW